MGYLIFSLLLSLALGDVYMHNPRGSNNRLNEANTNRNNANRVFDSQNNGKGGYAYGPAMSFVEGSKLMVEWTNQHSCGQGNTDCDIILQYMCTAGNAPDQQVIRDGTTTDTIAEGERVTEEENGQLKYGMHESEAFYVDCRTRERNKGLFHADQNLNRNDARATRQNPNGNRRGFECPEERDYYPYWHPTPWKDIAVFTTRADERCEVIEEQSQNVLAKGYCEGEPKFNRPETCNGGGGTWKEAAAFDLEPPECLEAPFNRDNHLGNGPNGQTNNYNWTLPTAEVLSCVGAEGGCNCALRLRYNISSLDYAGFAGENYDGDNIDFLTAARDGEASPIKNDPTATSAGLGVRLAINTNQFGRTFQDRSYMFHIIPRPEDVSESAVIWNLNVRGKRGNIVQTYPAVEYDFVPSSITIVENELIHFQWTGSDTNPNGNDGEGKQGTDRSNLVQMPFAGANYPIEHYNKYQKQPSEDEDDPIELFFEDADTRKYFAHLGQTNCAEYVDDDDPDDQAADNCMLLNAAPRHIDFGVHAINASQGTYHFMSSRNNNFTNRSQKLVINVRPLFTVWEIVGITVGALALAGVVGAAGTAAWAKTHPHSRFNKLWKFH